MRVSVSKPATTQKNVCLKHRLPQMICHGCSLELLALLKMALTRGRSPIPMDCHVKNRLRCFPNPPENSRNGAENARKENQSLMVLICAYHISFSSVFHHF